MKLWLAPHQLQLVEILGRENFVKSTKNYQYFPSSENLYHAVLHFLYAGLYACTTLPGSSTILGLSTFPSKYNDSFICSYTFIGIDLQKVKVTFLYLDIVNADCNKDKIEIYDGLTASTPSVRICNGNKVVEFTSSKKNVRMIYTGNSVGKYRGFHASVKFKYNKQLTRQLFDICTIAIIYLQHFVFNKLALCYCKQISDVFSILF